MIECSKKSAVCDEMSKAAIMQMHIATHADLLGVSRENSTIHNEIHWGILKLSCQKKKNTNYRMYLECLEKCCVSFHQIK